MKIVHTLRRLDRAISLRGSTRQVLVDGRTAVTVEGRDLALTTDFRSVFSEVAAKHLGAKRLEALFPGYAGGEKEWVGIL